MEEKTNIKLSGVIIAYNEEKNIARCLRSLADVVDEIVVIDSYSTDNTENICLNFGARVIQHTFENYVAQHRFADSQASYDYILNLDADEELSEELKKSVLEVKKHMRFDGYTISRITQYCGKWIRHCGWYPDYKLRLYDRRKGEWKGMLIHEKFELLKNAAEGRLKGDILHYSFYSVEQHLQQTDKFTTMSAQELYRKGKKSNWIKIYLKPVWKFISAYFFRLGFLDGYYGFVVCKISAKSVFLKYRKLNNLRQQKH